MSLRLGDIAPNFQQDSSTGLIYFYELFIFGITSTKIPTVILCKLGCGSYIGIAFHLVFRIYT